MAIRHVWHDLVFAVNATMFQMPEGLMLTIPLYHQGPRKRDYAIDRTQAHRSEHNGQQNMKMVTMV